MKKLTTILLSALALGAALPAIAGPDWDAIEHARKMPHRGSELVQTDVIHVAWATAPTEPQATAPAAVAPQVPASAALASPRCAMADRLVLPLDHGPRADTTPYMNRLRKERYDAQIRACKETSK